MEGTTERRQAILLRLCERRFETIGNLAFEFSVNRRTIRRDIEILSLSYPLYTTKGRGGGVYVVNGFRLGMKYLTEEQTALLECLLETLKGKDKEILHSIIKTFKRPEQKKE